MNLRVKRKARYYASYRSSEKYRQKRSNKSTNDWETIDIPAFQPDSSCTICQEPVGQPTLEGIIESWSQLPCGHRFGSHCIKRWLGMTADDQPCCPICRRNASHVCGHPVLPLVIEPSVTTGRMDDTDGRKRWSWFEKRRSRGGSEHWETPDLHVQHTYCGFCAVAPPAQVHTREVMTVRLVKGCWYLMRHGRRRSTSGSVQPPETTTTPRLWIGTRERDPSFERWWDEQEPRGA
jgi:hypothetical protein